MERVHFANARKLAEDNPKTFKRDLTGMAPGAHVKICDLTGPERFWIEIDSIDGEVISGRVANATMNFKYDSHLSITIDNVYAVYTGQRGEGDESDNIQAVCGTCNGR
jgi:hypothetical protein